MVYQPTLESVSTHPVPDWFHNAKLGIFIHWGLYSVPAFAPNAGELSDILASGEWAKWFANNPYAEWYMNSYQIADSPTHRYHHQTYGQNFHYRDFAPLFNQAVKAWNPDEWASLFKQVGARYAVLTTKHHDGFTLWPSQHTNPFHPSYHAERDLVGEFMDAVRKQGLTAALYYSGGLDWTFNPKVVQHISDLQLGVPQMQEYVDYANAHWRELIDRYGTMILWNDIAYPANTNLNELFAYYYNKLPEGVINNRFTQKFEMRDGNIVSDNYRDFDTPEYASFNEIREKKWESCRGIGASFGYNRIEGPEQYQTVENLVRMLVDIVSKNGNLLLNIGPMADGTIPEIQRERLLGLGKWLDVNGEAIFDTRPWQRAEGKTDSGIGVRFTQKAGTLYATLLDTPASNAVLIEGLQVAEGASVQLLGNSQPLAWQQRADGMAVTLPDLPNAPAHALKISS
ncbi:MAG: alpha-L-fucosidase [Caldilineaceae bacterium]